MKNRLLLILLAVFISVSCNKDEGIVNNDITATKTLSLVSPRAGDTLEAKSSTYITWTSNNISSIKIQYTSNGGSSWTTLSSNFPADSQKFYWPSVPDAPSSQCRIKLSDAENSLIADSNKSYFVIRSNRTLAFQKPVLSTPYYIGIQDTIRWTATNLTSVQIELSTDNGGSWTTLTSSYPASAAYYWTPTLAQPSNYCLLRISDAQNPGFSQVSNLFSVLRKNVFKLVKPNGGENLIAGSSASIEWSTVSASAVSSSKGGYSKPAAKTGTNDIKSLRMPNSAQSTGSVRIELTTDNGSTWNDIVSSTPDTGAYVWKSIPFVTSSLCKVRITSLQNPTLTDQSANTFSITTPVLKLLSPTGNETWEAGSTHAISWNSVGVDQIKLEFSNDGGANYTVLANNYMASVGSYSWTIGQDQNSTRCKIKISGVTTSITDVNANNFTITPLPKITVTKPNGNEVLPAGGSYDITWTSENIYKVKIEYTTNNGYKWFTITDSTESNGFYRWNPIPTLSSTNCRIRISDSRDAVPSDVSDGLFSIATQPQLRVVAPNGGEHIAAKSSYTINWTTSPGTIAGRIKAGAQDDNHIASANGILNVRIQFTTDGGTVWNPIINSTPNNGSYIWNPVSDVNSALCKVKINDANDTTVSDVSDSAFVIYRDAKSLRMLSPNGGESIIAGSSTPITWNSLGVAAVNLEYTTNNGVNWFTIVNNTESDGYYLWNPIPSTITSTNCKIRVIDASDPLLVDESDNTFTILPQPAISVLSPNGGESYSSDSKQNITWNSTGIANVTIELSSNNGASWDTIATKVVSSGQYLWTVPSVNSSLCKIRIKNYDGGIPSAVSAGTFSITTVQPQNIHITRPTGGESFTVGSQQSVTWTSSGISIVNLDYTTNNGVSWVSIATNQPSNGIYSWVIPNTVAGNCKVRISDAVDNTPTDQSPATFSIVPQPVLNLIQPNGNEKVLSGSSYEIKWNSTTLKRDGKAITEIKIQLSTDAGTSWSNIAASTPNNGSYQWSPVPVVTSSQCRVRISDAATGVPSDISDTNFTIYTQIPQSITVTAPNGGETYNAGDAVNIKWNSTGVAKVRIQYTTNNGLGWLPVVDSTESNGLYVWNIPQNVSSTNCKIKISKNTDSTLFSTSANTFTVLPAPALTVLSPNGGESFLAGSLQNITWTSQGVANVKIELTLNNGASWDSVIVASTISNGLYQWTVPAVNSTLCRVRISNANGGVPSDISDNNFTIATSQPQSVKVTRPAGGEVFTVGSQQNINWSSTGIANVKIEYTTNNGVSWSTVIASTPSNGIYSWTVPNTISTNCKVRISDAADGNPSDI
ncbi:MAG: hypothetical protein LWX56_03755, partial [Ignavibacteria bacterium]|nr:hypothetical protein [Ignavibacteria bacterium]